VTNSKKHSNLLQFKINYGHKNCYSKDCKDVKKLANDDIKVPNHQLFDRILAEN